MSLNWPKSLYSVTMEDYIYHFRDLSCFVRELSTLNTGMGQDICL